MTSRLPTRSDACASSLSLVLGPVVHAQRGLEARVVVADGVVRLDLDLVALPDNKKRVRHGFDNQKGRPPRGVLQKVHPRLKEACQAPPRGLWRADAAHDRRVVAAVPRVNKDLDLAGRPVARRNLPGFRSRNQPCVDVHSRPNGHKGCRGLIDIPKKPRRKACNHVRGLDILARGAGADDLPEALGVRKEVCLAFLGLCRLRDLGENVLRPARVLALKRTACNNGARERRRVGVGVGVGGRFCGRRLFGPEVLFERDNDTGLKAALRMNNRTYGFEASIAIVRASIPEDAANYAFVGLNVRFSADFQILGPALADRLLKEHPTMTTVELRESLYAVLSEAKPGESTTSLSVAEIYRITPGDPEREITQYVTRYEEEEALDEQVADAI